MSWSLQVEPRQAPDIFGAIDEAEPTHSLSDESLEQVREAKGRAKDIIQSACVGGEDKFFSVSLSGHANPGHDHTDGMADDFVTVNVYQRPAPEGSGS